MSRSAGAGDWPGFAAALLVILGAPLFAAPVELPPLVVKTARDQVAPEHGGIASLASVTPLDPISERLADRFQQVPGLITQDSFGGFDPPRLGVRGSGIQSAPTSRGLAISFFGMPMNAADGSFNLALLEDAWMESATLVRGPAAGVPALGGSLLLGHAGDAFGAGDSVAVGFGSDASFALSGSADGRVGDLDLTGRAAFNLTDGWRPHSAQERESGFAAIRSGLGEGWDLTVQLLASRPWYQVPGPMTEAAALNDPTATLAAVARDDPRRETEYAQLAARVGKRWGDSAVSFAVGGIYQDDSFYQLQANGVSDSEALETYLSFQAERDWNRAEQHTVFTVLLQAGWWDAARYRNDGGHRGKLIGEQQLDPLTLTASVDHRIQLTARQRLELGISTLTASRDVDDRLPASPGRPSVDLAFGGTRVAPRIAWSWNPLAETTIVASYARSFEPPTYGDLLFTTGPLAARELRSGSLDWQRADSFELALRGRYERFRGSSAVYYAPWRGEFLRLANPDGSTRGTVNAGRTVHTGVENQVEIQLLEEASIDLTGWATYNYTVARFDEDPVNGDGRLAGVPPHTGALGLRAVAPGGWFIAPGCQWRAGETYADHAHDLGYGGTALWSLELGRRHPDGWSVSLGIHNLFDRRAIASTAGVLDRAPVPQNAAIFLPAAGRTVGVRLEAGW